jgi:hypothetical protein
MAITITMRRASDGALIVPFLTSAMDFIDLLNWVCVVVAVWAVAVHR